ncbi:tyrosine-type recombinase/integrase [Microbacterium sp. P07]|uniref:tyrosine-type recombinase/integrase n=1 Tax=Microbacterium sp. P07 TaxID=3366952 RepID=UPI003745D0A4
MASIQQRPSGSWRARYEDADGHEHARHFPLKRDAQRWLDEVTAAVVTGQYADPRAGKVTWSVWVKSWMDRQTWVEGTRQAASTAFSSVPWGEKPIASVKASHVQAWVTGESKRGLAASTIKTRLNYVQMAFRAAAIDRVIPTSPVLSVKAPRTRKAEAAMKLLSAEQVRAALEGAGDFGAFIAVCAFAGLRLGEAAGLQLRDVNFLGRSIRVERQVQGSTIKASTLVPPKCGSERTVFVPDELTKILAAHVARHAVKAHDEMLFTTPLGQMWNRNSAAGEWRRIRAAAGVGDDVTIHTLRHTYASNLIASGCDVVTVQRALGHAQPSITLNVYAHLWPSAEDKTRAATAEFMSSVLTSTDSGRTQTTKAQVTGLS